MAANVESWEEVEALPIDRLNIQAGVGTTQAPDSNPAPPGEPSHRSEWLQDLSLCNLCSLSDTWAPLLDVALVSYCSGCKARDSGPKL